MKAETIMALLFLGTIAGTVTGYFINKYKLKHIIKNVIESIGKQKLKGDGDFGDSLIDSQQTKPNIVGIDDVGIGGSMDKTADTSNTHLSEGSDHPKKEEEIVKGDLKSPPLPPNYFDYKNLKDGKK